MVVAEDGSGWYRIVDGERRWRALKTIQGEGGETVARVFSDYTEASEAVAMVATDAKKELTDQERAKGFQQMLTLDVPVVTMARATRRTNAEINQARRAARLAGGEQATLDQLIAAGEFDDETQQRKILTAPPERWQSVAESVRRAAEKAERGRMTRANIEAAGVTVVDGLPSAEEYEHAAYVRPETDVATIVAGAADDFVAHQLDWDPSQYRLMRRIPEPVPETDEERAAREAAEAAEEERKRIESAWKDLTRAVIAYAVEHIGMHATREGFGTYRRHYLYVDHIVTSIVTDVAGQDATRRSEVADLVEASADMPLSHFELLETLHRMRFNGRGEWSELAGPLVECARKDGYVPSEEDIWLCERAREAEEAKGGDGDE